MRLRFSAGRRTPPVSLFGNRPVRRVVLPDEDEEWDEDVPLEVIPGDLSLAPSDEKPGPPAVPPFRVGFAKPEEVVWVPPRSI